MSDVANLRTRLIALAERELAALEAEERVEPERLRAVLVMLDSIARLTDR